jgi:hypothetical protein
VSSCSNGERSCLEKNAPGNSPATFAHGAMM